MGGKRLRAATGRDLSCPRSRRGTRRLHLICRDAPCLQVRHIFYLGADDQHSSTVGAVTLSTTGGWCEVVALLASAIAGNYGELPWPLDELSIELERVSWIRNESVYAAVLSAGLRTRVAVITQDRN